MGVQMSERAARWLIVAEPFGIDMSHAFHAKRDGTVSASLCSRRLDGRALDRPGSRRHGKVCHECKSRFAKLPAAFAQPCATPQPSSGGSPCRNCGVPIMATHPGWRHQ